MKNKFALCFRPVGIETEETDRKLRGSGTTNHDRHVAVSKSIAVSKEHKNKKMPAGMLGNVSRKAISWVLRSVLFETSPGIRVGDGKNRQITFVQSNDISSVAENKPVKKRDKTVNIQQVSSSSFSSTTSSTSSTTANPSSETNDDSKPEDKRAFAISRSNSFDEKKKPTTTKANDKSCSSKEDLVLYLIILALFATIIWGKVFAVLFTSLCLYIIPMGLNVNGFLWGPKNAV